MTTRFGEESNHSIVYRARGKGQPHVKVAKLRQAERFMAIRRIGHVEGWIHGAITVMHETLQWV